MLGFSWKFRLKIQNLSFSYYGILVALQIAHLPTSDESSDSNVDMDLDFKCVWYCDLKIFMKNVKLPYGPVLK